jgi:uncharacterized ubiquitin-like protein YukD
VIHARADASGLVRVTVTSSTRRVDLALPGAVPVAELLPELARSVGLLDAATAHGGYRLVTRRGQVLAADCGLTSQGVVDGGILAVAAGVDDRAPRVYDDVVEAMADAVEGQLTPWGAAAARRTTTWVAVVLLLLGAGALLGQHESRSAVLASVVLAAVLLPGGIALSRTRVAAHAAVLVATMGCLYAAVAGLMLAWGSAFLLPSLTVAGGGLLVAGAVAALGLVEGRVFMLPALVVGGVLLATGVLTRASTLEPTVVLTSVVALVVVLGGWFPWIALGATTTRVDGLDIDPARVAADARIAHQILVAVSASVGLLLVLASPMAVSLGRSGTLVSVLSCLVIMLRARRHRCGTEVLVGVVGGVLGLVSTALSVLWLHPGWRTATALCLAVTGAVLLALTLLPQSGSVRRSHFADLLESCSTLTLVPTLVVASGLFSLLQG